MIPNFVKYAASARIFDTEFTGPAMLDQWSRCGPDVKLGKYVSLGEHSSIIRTDVGNYVSIGDRVAINPFDHPTNWFSHHEFQYRADSFNWDADYRMLKRLSREQHMELPRCSISNDVWIGSGVVIASGCMTIGDGAIVAANAVVTHPVPPYTIVGGVPARIIGLRFPHDIVKRFLALDPKWWDRPLWHLDGLLFNDPLACLEVLEKGNVEPRVFKSGYQREAFQGNPDRMLGEQLPDQPESD